MSSRTKDPDNDARSHVSIKMFPGGFSPCRVSKLAVGFHSEFLGPIRVSASISNQGSFFGKASTEAAAFSLAAHPRRTMYPSDLPFTRAGREQVDALWRSIPCQCVSLAFRFIGYPRQPPELWARLWKNFSASSHRFVCRKSNRRRLFGRARHPIELRGMSDKNTGRIAPPRPARKELNYLLIESLVIEPPFSIFTLITWIWPLSA
jgi:hypothetical protein